MRTPPVVEIRSVSQSVNSRGTRRTYNPERVFCRIPTPMRHPPTDLRATSSRNQIAFPKARGPTINRHVVPALAGPNRLKAGLRTNRIGSWPRFKSGRLRFSLSRCSGFFVPQTGSLPYRRLATCVTADYQSAPLQVGDVMGGFGDAGLNRQLRCCPAWDDGIAGGCKEW